MAIQFIVDENLSPQLADGLSGFGEDVKHITEVFHAGILDDDWLPEVGRQGLTLVTRDRRIRFKPAELRAYRQNNVGGFVLGGKSLKRCDIIEQIVRNWRRMKKFAAKYDPPFLFRIPPRGTKFDRIL